ANPLYLRCGGSLDLCGQMVTMIAWATYTALACVNGGHHSAPVMWYVSIPVFAISLSGNRSGVVWTFLSVLAIVRVYVARRNGIELPDELTLGAKRFLEFTGMLGILSCVFLLTFLFHRVENNAEQAIRLALSEAQAADRAKTEFL